MVKLYQDAKKQRDKVSKNFIRTIILILFSCCVAMLLSSYVAIFATAQGCPATDFDGQIDGKNVTKELTIVAPGVTI